MANHKSAAKRARQTSGRTLRNRLIIGSLRSSLKAARVALEKGDATEAAPLVSLATKSAARAASKGVIHRNSAARLNSRLQVHLNKLSAA